MVASEGDAPSSLVSETSALLLSYKAMASSEGAAPSFPALETGLDAGPRAYENGGTRGICTPGDLSATRFTVSRNCYSATVPSG